MHHHQFSWIWTFYFLCKNLCSHELESWIYQYKIILFQMPGLEIHIFSVIYILIYIEFSNNTLCSFLIRLVTFISLVAIFSYHQILNLPLVRQCSLDCCNTTTSFLYDYPPKDKHYIYVKLLFWSASKNHGRYL